MGEGVLVWWTFLVLPGPSFRDDEPLVVVPAMTQLRAPPIVLLVLAGGCSLPPAPAPDDVVVEYEAADPPATVAAVLVVPLVLFLPSFVAGR